jgi:hypothetical protein
MARTAGRRTREPRSLPRPGRSDRHRRWMPGLGPGRQAAGKTARAASAESGVRPGPRPRHYAQATAKQRKQGTCRSSLIIPADLYCMGFSGQVSVGHAELATMDVFEEGQIDPASSIMPDTCPGRRSDWSSRKPRCCGGRCVRPPVRHQSGSGLSRTSLARAPTTPQVVSGTRAPRLPAVMRWRKGRLGRGLRRRAHESLLRADWVPVAEHQGRRILYGTGTDG